MTGKKTNVRGIFLGFKCTKIYRIFINIFNYSLMEMSIYGIIITNSVKEKIQP